METQGQLASLEVVLVQHVPDESSLYGQLSSLCLLEFEVLEENTNGRASPTSIAESQMTMNRTPKMKLTIFPKKVTPLAELSVMEVLLAPTIPPLLNFLNK